MDIPELAEEVAEQLGVLAEEKNQTVSVRSVAVPRWMGDRMVLRQALLNLIDNAIKYSPVGGTIDIGVAPSPEGICIDVSDTGPGIPADLRSRIFDRFYRVEKSRSREKGGSGLGLAISRAIVTAHSGTLEAQSTHAGATFTMRLPAET